MLEHIVRQHAEQAAFLWTVYDRALRFPEENPEMDADRLDRVLEQLEAHVAGMRIAGEDGRRIAAERYAEFPEAGELFLCRMLEDGARQLSVAGLDLERVRAYLAHHLS